MPINVFGNSSSSHGDSNETDTSLIVKKAYLRTTCRQKIFEEEIDMEIKFTIQNLTCL